MNSNEWNILWLLLFWLRSRSEEKLKYKQNSEILESTKKKVIHSTFEKNANLEMFFKHRELPNWINYISTQCQDKFFTHSTIKMWLVKLNWWDSREPNITVDYFKSLMRNIILQLWPFSEDISQKNRKH